MSDDRRPAYIGRIERDPATGEIGGTIREVLTGWGIDLVLTKARSGSGYEVKGYLSPDRKDRRA